MEPREPSAPPDVELGVGGSIALFAFLLFLGFPLSETLDDPPPAAHVALILAGLGAFVAIYVRAMISSHSARDVHRSIAALALVALALSVDDTADWTPTFIYVSAVCGFRLPRRRAAAGVLAATAATGVLSFAAGYETGDAITYVLYCVGIGALLMGFAHVAEINRELHAARDEIARLAVGEERLRFARDLHDLLGHSLSVIALKSELARRLLGVDAARAEEEVRDIEQVAREALVEVREAVSGYRRMTLPDELRGAEAALRAAGIEPEVSRPAVTFAPEVEAVLAWAVREGTTNVIRHSGASHCAIRVHAGLTDAGVEIVDDGAADAAPSAGGSGLAGLEERVRRRQGRLEAGSAPGGGFRLAVHVPALP